MGAPYIYDISRLRVKVNSAAVVGSTSGLEATEGFHKFWLSTEEKPQTYVEPDRYEMAHGDTLDGKLRGNRRMEWDPVSRQLKHTIQLPEVDCHLHRFAWIRPFHRTTKTSPYPPAISF